MVKRATRDAATLRTPLYLIQAADTYKPHMPADLTKKLMNKANPKDTGNVHGMLLLHLGMHVRLLDAISSDGLVKDAEGIVVHIEVDPEDKAAEAEALANYDGAPLYLKRLPLGVWIRMDKYNRAPFQQTLHAHDVELLPDDTKRLVFVEPITSKPFAFREYAVVRTGFALSHGRVLTSTACQGRTMREGVIIDCGRHENGNTIKEDEDWWLDLYVMLSRATRIEDLLLERAPPLSFFLSGPPKLLQTALKQFAKRTRDCRVQAKTLAMQLRLEKFLRD